jgi:hypothetical protein
MEGVSSLMSRAYHVQFGFTRQIGRFLAEGLDLGQGQSVVVRSSRGMELGTVVAEAEVVDPSGLLEILRIAGPGDHQRAARLAADRHRRFEQFRVIFDEGEWPIEPIDVEPLLDEDRVVLHYLGPHKLDLAGLRAALRVSCGLDLIFEPVGRDIPEPEPEPESEPEAESGCGSGSCGTGGGCGSKRSGSDGGAKSGCAGCTVGALVAKRRRAPSLA